MERGVLRGGHQEETDALAYPLSAARPFGRGLEAADAVIGDRPDDVRQQPWTRRCGPGTTTRRRRRASRRSGSSSTGRGRRSPLPDPEASARSAARLLASRVRDEHEGSVDAGPQRPADAQRPAPAPPGAQERRRSPAPSQPDEAARAGHLPAATPALADDRDLDLGEAVVVGCPAAEAHGLAATPDDSGEPAVRPPVDRRPCPRRRLARGHRLRPDRRGVLDLQPDDRHPVAPGAVEAVRGSVAQGVAAVDRRVRRSCGARRTPSSRTPSRTRLPDQSRTHAVTGGERRCPAVVTRCEDEVLVPRRDRCQLREDGVAATIEPALVRLRDDALRGRVALHERSTTGCRPASRRAPARRTP